ncbi:RNA polymerase sigma factor SigA [Striga asiatica]|uniref:RNA polymerase sigma factor SigA n=1 Tax=Striga asiatica TaxID=4170 RepID=A0A5A7PLB8_STRAF|nr:RNA polymerase sigma factor SigA [Striga asiatica]
MATESSKIIQPQTVDSSLGGPNPLIRTDIDTSAPFESVKEKASRFNNMGFWKPARLKPSSMRLMLSGGSRYIYRGPVYIKLDIAQDLLRPVDQYLLEGLKRFEYAIAVIA